MRVVNAACPFLKISFVFYADLGFVIGSDLDVIARFPPLSGDLLKISSAHGISSAFFFPLLGEIAPNFNLKYMILTYKKEYFIEKK